MLTMKNIVLSFNQLLAIAACALTLGSCNRAEYAMLPKGSSYHGVTRVATPVPTQPEKTAAAAATVSIAAAEKAVVLTPVASTPASAATAPEATPVAQPEKKAVVAAPAAQITEATAIATAPQSARKVTRLQKLAASRVVRAASTISGVTQFSKTLATAKAQKISGNLRIGIILLLIGLLVGIFSRLIGTIVALLGVIFIILWLLDNL